MIQVVDVAIWSIAAESPHNDIMKRPAALAEFRRLVRSTFNLIKARTRRARRHQRLPRDARLGRGTDRADVDAKGRPPAMIYDQNRTLKGFVRALTIGIDQPSE
jgi:hypothetical protein